MKNQLSIALLNLLFCAFNASWLRAQDTSASSGEFRIGLSGGATYNFHYMSSSDPFWVNDCGCGFDMEGRTTAGYSVGLVAEYRFANRFGLASHILFSTHPRSDVGLSPNAPVIVPSHDPGSPPQIEDRNARLTADIEYNLFEVDLLARVRVLPVGEGGLGLAFGVAVGQTERLEQTRLLHVIESDNARFVPPTEKTFQLRDSGRTVVLAEDMPLKNASTVRLSLRSGMFFEIALFDRLHITPGAYFDYGLTSILREFPWMLNVMMFQLDVTARL